MDPSGVLLALEERKKWADTMPNIAKEKAASMEKQGLFGIGIPGAYEGMGGGWQHMGAAAQALVEHGRSLGTALASSGAAKWMAGWNSSAQGRRPKRWWIFSQPLTAPGTVTERMPD